MLRVFVLVTVAALAHSLPAHLEAMRFKRQADIAPLPSGASLESFKAQFPSVGSQFLDLINLYKMFSQKQTAADEPSGCELVVFGNSLSDNGASAIEDKHGFRRYTNGPIWNDYLAGDLGCKLRNRAYAGAMSGARNYYFEHFSGQDWQLDNFLAEYPQIPDNMIIGYESTGINDILYTDNIKGDAAAYQAMTQAVVDNNFKSLTRLLKAGASKIIMLDNWEGFSHAPDVAGGAILGTEAFQKHVDFINKGLAEKYEELKGLYPDVKFVLTKTAGFYDDMVAKLKYPGQTFTHHKGNTTFGEWNEYGYYDTFHPTTVVHKMLADRALDAWNQAT